jgi:hypothetical protein
VIELSEQTVIDQLVGRLTSRFPAISQSTVERVDGRPLRDYVPLFVERSARSELDQLHATAR